jgi:hypothetical protein
MPLQSLVQLLLGMLYLGLLWAFGVLPNASHGFWAVLLIAWFGFFIDDKLSKIAKSVECDTEPPERQHRSRSEELREKRWYRQIIAQKTLAGTLVALYLLLFFWTIGIPPSAAPVAWIAGLTAWFAFNMEGNLARIANALKANVVGGYRLRSITSFLNASVNIPADERLGWVIRSLKFEKPRTKPHAGKWWHSVVDRDAIVPRLFFVGFLWGFLRSPGDSPLLWTIALITWFGLSFDKKLARIARALESEIPAHDWFEQIAMDLRAETAQTPK